MQPSKNNILSLGISSFSILGILSLFYYKERTVFLDLSYILFKIIQTDSLAIQLNRFVSVFTQGSAYAAVNLNLPLSVVAQIYSLSFVAFQFIFFLLILKMIKDKMLALGLLLFNLLMVTHTFFWTASELIQGMAFVFVFFALLNKVCSDSIKHTYLNHFLLVLSLITISFAHPLLNVPMVFGLAFFSLQYSSKRKTTLFYGLALIIIYFLKQKYFSNSYDLAASKGLENFSKLFPNYYTPSFKKFTSYLLKDYYFLSLGLIAITGFYLWSKQHTKALLILLSFVAYACLINVCFPTNQQQFYLESQYLPLSFFIILPFVVNLLPELKDKTWPCYLIILVVVVGLIRIIGNHKFYTYRVQWNRNLIERCDELNYDKVILLDKHITKHKLMLSWGLSYETWLLSTIEQGSTKSIVAIRNEARFNEDLDRAKCYFSLWNKTMYQNLNSRYFIFNDSTSFYKKYGYMHLGIIE